MKSIRIFGDTSKVVESPPPIVIEFMDKDTVVSGWGQGWAWPKWVGSRVGVAQVGGATGGHGMSGWDLSL